MFDSKLYCTLCKKEIINPPLDIEAGEALYCSFKCEVKGLLDGLGWGVKWLILSLAWGLSLFTFIVLIGRLIWGESIADPLSYYGLVVVFGLLTVILTVWWRKLKY